MKKLFQTITRNAIYMLFIICLFIVVVIRPVFRWYDTTFGVSIVEILFTIKSPLKGADTSFLRDVIQIGILSVLFYVIVLSLLFVSKEIEERCDIALIISKKIRIPLIKLSIIVLFSLSLLESILTVNRINNTLQVTDYVKNRFNETHIYEEFYVKPKVELIKADNPKNLIYIYMESLETTYASKDIGGYQEVNYIPNLTQMAKDNISFSDSDMLGGFKCTSRTGYTTGAIFATESGIPFMFPGGGNEDYTDREGMATRTVCLGDILKEKGYYQEFLCGSDATFGGKRSFFQQHGDFLIYDVNTAIKNGYITEDQIVWWGLEDKNLYRIAKDELTRIADLNQPFNFTMLTVDTHHVDGWVCDLCGDEYPDQLANVVQCADNQIYDFIEWCKEQDWYDNTVIVIEGDHPRMDTSLVDGVDYFDRTVYNCFINTNFDKNSLALSNREFTPLDMFPTILSSLGYYIPGNKLGLGTDLFSESPTIAEEYGIEFLDYETSLYSQYFIDNFS